MKKKVVLNYLSYIHYRASLFEMLQDDTDFSFKLVCGRKSPLNVKSIENDNNTEYLVNYWIDIWRIRIIWQKEIVRITNRLKPDVVVLLGVNPLIVSSLISFFVHKFLFRKTIIWWGHGTLGHQGAIGRIVRKFFYYYADGIMTYDKRGKEKLVEIGIQEKKITVLGNCINDQEYGFNKFDIEKNRLQKVFKDQVKLLFIGRLTKSKQVELAIKAVNVLSKKYNLTFTIIGDGDQFNILKDMTKNMDLENIIEFKGELYADGVDEYLLNADLFIHPGSIGLSIIHAFSFGLPVITHNNIESQKPEYSLLIPGKNGEVYKQNNLEELIEKIEKAVPKIKSKSYYLHCLSAAQQNTPAKVHKVFKSVVLNKG